MGKNTRDQAVSGADEAKAELIEALRAKDISQWRIGDAALKFAPIGESGLRSGSYELLATLVDAELGPKFGVNFNTILVYRQVAHVFPPDTRVQASWSAHRAALTFPQLIRAGMTVQEVREAVKKAALQAERARVAAMMVRQADDDETIKTTRQTRTPGALPRRLSKADIRYEHVRIAHTLNRARSDLCEAARVYPLLVEHMSDEQQIASVEIVSEIKQWADDLLATMHRTSDAHQAAA